MKNRVLFIILLFNLSLFAQNNQSKIFTSDIDNFWVAYDSVLKTKDKSLQIRIIQELYLDKATEGLKEFIVSREHTAQRHLINILSYPKFWKSLRPKTLEIASYKKEIEIVMSRFQKLYPNFKQPEVYFTIGCLNSGGTTTENKILIGAEIACSDKNVDASELGNWLQRVFLHNINVVYLVAHESVHTQQHEVHEGYSNLLFASIYEGSCDFIGELLLENQISSPYMMYGRTNEKTLWNKFKQEMYGDSLSDWLYNGEEAPNGVADLGYYMGYEISKSYYQNSTNKEKALKEIIEVDNKKESILEFFKRSGYAKKWD